MSRALPDLPHVIELRYPIAVTKNGKPADPITAVTILRRPRYRDLERVMEVTGKARQGRRMVSLITNLSEEAFGEADLEDAKNLLEAVSAFFADDEEDPSASSAGGDESQ